MGDKQRGQDAGKNTLQAEELRRLETYLQHRLDNAGGGDMKISQPLFAFFLALVRKVQRGGLLLAGEYSRGSGV